MKMFSNQFQCPKKRNQKRVGTQKWKRHVLLNARRGLLNTTHNEVSCISSDVLNKSEEDSPKSSNIYQDSNVCSYRLNAVADRCNNSDELNINPNEYVLLNESDIRDYEDNDLNLLNIDDNEK